jgi:hypothetical protein
MECPDNIGSDFNMGFSWGLEYPMIYGERPNLFDGFLVWDRYTGDVKASFPHKRNVHGYSSAETDARRFSMPDEYTFNNFEFDAVT